jgi:hypothetical protein
MGFLNPQRPRRINPVSVGVVLLLVGLGYLGYKFVPVYWNARKVDDVLDAARFKASEIDPYRGQDLADRLLEQVTDDIVELGVDPTYLEVYFEGDYTSLHADYTVFVHLPFGKTVTLEFARKVDIPPGRGIADRR